MIGESYISNHTVPLYLFSTLTILANQTFLFSFIVKHFLLAVPLLCVLIRSFSILLCENMTRWQTDHHFVIYSRIPPFINRNDYSYRELHGWLLQRSWCDDELYLFSIEFPSIPVERERRRSKAGTHHHDDRLCTHGSFPPSSKKQKTPFISLCCGRVPNRWIISICSSLTQGRERVCTLVPQLLQLTSSIDITQKFFHLRVKMDPLYIMCTEAILSSTTSNDLVQLS